MVLYNRLLKQKRQSNKGSKS